MIRHSQTGTARAACAAPAAPAGGAQFYWGRGCGYLSAALLCLSATVTAATASATSDPAIRPLPVALDNAAALLVPSGQAITLSDVLLDSTLGGLWVRFRFEAPQIAREGGGISQEQAAQDLDHLCATLALPLLQAQGIEPERIVLSLADRPVAFGEQDPAATQYFELYRSEAGNCIWEGF